MAHAAASEAERASLGFALGRLLDGRGEYPGAFEVYVAANRASRASAGPRFRGYDRVRQEQITQRLLASTVVPANDLTLAASTPRPIFICGMFRSGSTLTEQLIAAHPDVAGGGELDILPRIVAELTPFPESMTALTPERASRLARRYLEEARELFPAARRVTDKRLDNFLRLGLIRSLFPAARIVHTTRDPLDNCLSIFFLHLDQGMSYALDLLDIGHFYREYRRLMAHWQGLFGADLFEFNYDRFVREPARTAAELFAFLDLEWDERYLVRPPTGRAVKTASVWQVREPLHERSSGRARHYTSQLAALRDYLADLLPR